MTLQLRNIAITNVHMSLQLGLDQAESAKRLRPTNNMKEHLIPTLCKALPAVKQTQSRYTIYTRSRSSSSDEDIKVR